MSRKLVKKETVRSTAFPKPVVPNQQVEELKLQLKISRDKIKEQKQQLEKLEADKAKLRKHNQSLQKKLDSLPTICEEFPLMPWTWTPREKEEQFRPQYKGALEKLKAVYKT